MIILFYFLSPLSLDRLDCFSLFPSSLQCPGRRRRKRRRRPHCPAPLQLNNHLTTTTTASQPPLPKPIHYNIIKIQKQLTQNQKSKHNQPKINGVDLVREVERGGAFKIFRGNFGFLLELI